MPTGAEILERYTYHLPQTAIAQHPIEPRDSSRLLVLPAASRGDDPAAGSATAAQPRDCRHLHFRDLPDLLEPGDLLVLNDTRVIPARLFGRKVPSGGRAEILLLADRGEETWEALLRYSGRKRAGQLVDLGEGYRLELRGPAAAGAWRVTLQGPGSVEELLERTGHVPLPPYIRRPDEPADRERYQTVFARQPGAVAAPTAGLHFTPRLLAALEGKGIERAWVTLHVGPGTFRPMKAEDLERGMLHEERYGLPEETASAVDRARRAGRRVVAVGTTTTRVLEACARESGELTSGEGVTRIFIRPPYRPRVVDALLTNFHLPRSSLLMLVATFTGRRRLLAAYAEALARGYRFYSYGDAMLVMGAE